LAECQAKAGYAEKEKDKRFRIHNCLMNKYELPALPYGYDALEPHIDAKTMEIHHTKHHQTYTNNLNAALEKCPQEVQNKDITEILSDLNSVPNDLRSAINSIVFDVVRLLATL